MIECSLPKTRTQQKKLINVPLRLEDRPLHTPCPSSPHRTCPGLFSDLGHLPPVVQMTSSFLISLINSSSTCQLLMTVCLKQSSSNETYSQRYHSYTNWKRECYPTYSCTYSHKPGQPKRCIYLGLPQKLASEAAPHT